MNGFMQGINIAMLNHNNHQSDGDKPKYSFSPNDTQNDYIAMYTQKLSAGSIPLLDNTSTGSLQGNNGNVFKILDLSSNAGGLTTDILKAGGANLGSVGIWKDLSNVKYYFSGWSGNGTVKAIGTATAIGYGMFGLSIFANVGLSITLNQSWSNTGINVGINAVMLKMPPPISLGYGFGSMIGQIQQNAFDLLNDNERNNAPYLYNIPW